MAKIKGTDIVSLRKLVREKGELTEQSLLKAFSDEEKKTYLETSPISWTPVDLQARVYQVASDSLFPGQFDSVIRLQLEIAKRSYSNFYKIFLAIPSVAFIMKRAASIWRTYYDTGKATVENLSESTFEFVVTDFPDLPEQLRDATTAHLIYLTQATGKKGVSVKQDDKDVNRWVWRVSWKP